TTCAVQTGLTSLIGNVSGVAAGANFLKAAFAFNPLNSATFENTADHFDTTHADFTLNVRNSDLNIGGAGRTLRSVNGNVILQAVDPANPTGLLAGDTVGATQGGSIGVLDGSTVRSAFNLQLVATQNVLIGNVVSYNALATPFGGPAAANPVTTTGAAAGVMLQAGAFNPAFTPSSLDVLPMTVTGQTWSAGNNASPFATIGQVLIDNRNPNNPGAQLPANAQAGQATVATTGNGFVQSGAVRGMGAFERFGSDARQVVMGDNVSLVSVGGTADLTNNRNGNSNLGTITGGVLIRSANTFSAGNFMTLGSFGGNTVIDAANGITLSNPIAVNNGGSITVTPSANGNWIFSVAALVPEVMNPAGGAGQFNAAGGLPIAINGTFVQNSSVPMYSGGGIGFYAGVPLGVYNNVTTVVTGLVDVNQQLYAGIQSRDNISRLNIINPIAAPPSGFAAGSNFGFAANGSLIVAMVEQAQQVSAGQKFTNGITLSPNGGVILLDPPADGPYVYLGGATLLQANAPASPPIPGGGLPPGTVLVNGNLVTQSVSQFSVPTIGSGLVATDSTRSVTIGLSQAAQTMLDNGYLKKQSGEGQNAYYIAGGACQPFFLEDDQDTMMVGEQGTAFKADNRTVTLQQGKIVAMVGKAPIKVSTGFGDVSISGNSAAIVQQTEGGVTRVANLSGKQTTITVNRGGKIQTLTAEAGEEICLADESLSEEELIPVDGVDREPIVGTVVVPGVKIAKSKFDQKMMVEKEKLLVCNSGSFYQAKNKINNLKDKVEKEAKPLRQDGGTAKPLLRSMIEIPANPQEVSESESMIMKPISFAQNTGSSNTLRTLTTHTALVKHNGKAVIGFEHPTIMQIHEGEVLVSADKVTVVKTPHSVVTINPNTIALISVENKVTKVRNLWELGHGCIRQTVAGKFVDICAGEESILGWDQLGVNKALSKDVVGRRKVRGIDVPGGMYMQRAEVSLVALMQPETSEFLHDLVSSNNPNDKALANKLVKMAAVLTQVTAKHGQFVQIQQGPKK
ncbi:MAG: hypothetical protein K2X27_25375, partial [Candidatus Obscuribacterales bacterium]|nr:hypothetical protein [Candidatus Obscuribacterales bacterium]